MIRKQNILATVMTFSDQLKTFMKIFLQRDNLPICHLSLFSKIPNRKKVSNEQFHLCEAEISLKFINIFSNELTPILLDEFDSWDKLDIMGISSRAEVISFIYKQSDKEYTANDRSNLLLNLDYKIYTSILKKCMQKP